MKNSLKENQEIIEYVRKVYLKNGSGPIIKKYGISKNQVTRLVKFLTLGKITKENRSKICVRSYEKDFSEYNVNPNTFLEVSQAESAYLLGFLWADGHLSDSGTGRSIRCHIVEKDALDLKSTFLKTGIWKFYFEKRQKESWQDQYVICTNNRHIYDFLEENDYKNKTSASPDKILSKIPNHLKHYWWRGYFDGDGNIYLKWPTTQMTFSGPFEQNWKFAENVFNDLNIDYRINRNISKKNHKSSSLRTTKIDSCIKFLDYIYKDREVDHIGLSRKYLTSLELKEKDKNTVRRRGPKSSKYFGIGKRGDKWSATIFKNKMNNLEKQIHLGYFKSELEALSARENYLATHKISDIIPVVSEKIYASKLEP